MVGVFALVAKEPAGGCGGRAGKDANHTSAASFSLPPSFCLSSASELSDM